MELNFKTLTCLMMLIVLYKEVAGEIKKADDSLPIEVLSKEPRYEDPPFFYLAYPFCKMDDKFCNITDSWNRIIAYFDIKTDTKVDHFKYKAELKFLLKEINVKTSGDKIIDETAHKYNIENKDIPQNHTLFIEMGAFTEDLEEVQGQKGKLIISLEGVDESEKVVALWKVEVDVEVEAEEEYSEEED